MTAKALFEERRNRETRARAAVFFVAAFSYGLNVTPRMPPSGVLHWLVGLTPPLTLASISLLAYVSSNFNPVKELTADEQARVGRRGVWANLTTRGRAMLVVCAIPLAYGIYDVARIILLLA